jgi:hypothetical protein
MSRQETKEAFDPEFYFRRKSLQVRLNQISSEHETLALEEEQLLYELDQLTRAEQELKPKTLKKTNDQPSRNNVEVQE